MADNEFEKVQLVGRRVPDFQPNKDESGNVVHTELPGTYEYGVMFGKRFVQLGSFHAGNVLNPDGSHVEPDDSGGSAKKTAS